MGLVILLILIGVPTVELWLLIEVGGEIGAAATIALIILTAVLGTVLFRIQGLATLERLRGHIDRGETPAVEAVSGFGLLFAGLLLLIPGFATDALGFLLFIPPLRRWLAGMIIAYLVARGGTTVFVNLRGGGFGGRGPGGGPGGAPGGRPGGGSAPGGRGDIIEGEYEDLSDRPTQDESSPDDTPSGETGSDSVRPTLDRPRD